MPQFDIASFYPQITFFAGTFLMFYAYVNKDILPKISQNLKLNRKLSEIYNMCVGKGTGGVSLITYIYGPSRTLSHAIYAETIYIVHLYMFMKTATLSYLSTLAYLNSKTSQIRLLKFSSLYLTVLADVLGSDDCTRRASPVRSDLGGSA
jgi:Plant ATP synthase F0